MKVDLKQIITILLLSSVAHNAHAAPSLRGESNGAIDKHQNQRELAPKLGRIRVKINKIQVYSTPYDGPGGHEEWEMDFKLDLNTHPSISNQKGKRFYPKSQRPGTYNLGVELDSGLFEVDGRSYNAVQADGKIFYKPYRIRMWGKETDQWPNQDNSLPSCYSPWFDFKGGRELKNLSFDCSKSNRPWTLYFDVIKDVYGAPDANPCNSNPCKYGEICQRVGATGYRCVPVGPTRYRSHIAHGSAEHLP